MARTERRLRQIKKDDEEFRKNVLVQLDGNASPPLSPSLDNAVINSNRLLVCSINAYSVRKKLNDVADLFEFVRADVVLFSETFETDALKVPLENFSNSCGVTWHSRPRVSGKGGGVAIAVRNSFGQSIPLSPPNPNEVEVTWALITPACQPSIKILACAFYYPPIGSNYRPEPDAIPNHILEVISYYANRHKNLYVVIGADSNDLDLSDMISCGFEQLVSQPTRGDKTLDVILSDLTQVGDSWVTKPLAPDDEGASSDHNIPFVELLLPKVHPGYETVWRRKFKRSSLDKFKAEFTGRDWDTAMFGLDLDSRVTLLNETLDNLTNKYFPLKKVRVRIGEEVWFNDRLSELKEKASRLYRLQKNSQEFKEAKRKFRAERRKAEKNYFSESLKNLKGDPKNWHSKVKRLAANDARRTVNRAPDLVCFNGLSDRECAEKVADHIESITSDYTPIDYQDYHSDFAGGEFEAISMEDVTNALKSIRIPDGLDKTDASKRILKHDIQMFALPLFHVFSLAVSTCRWPSAWKTESVTMIPKKKLPQEIKDLRPISITPLFSKALETIVRTELRKTVTPNLHQNQFGGKGGGTDLYLANMMHSAAKVADNLDYLQVQLFFDFSQAFSSISHQHVLKACADLGASNQLIRILSSYLCNRRMQVNWNEEVSSLRHVKGGAGQGTLLSVELFCIAVDGLLKSIQSKIDLTEQDDDYKTEAYLYIDDLRILVKLNRQTMPVGEDGVIVFQDGNKICDLLGELERFTVLSGMKLNRTKTVAVVIDTATENRVFFPPGCIQFPGGEEVKIQDDTKILGFEFTCDLSLDKFVAKRRSSAMSALWDLRRLSNKGIPTDILLQFYKSYVRSRLEYAVPSVFPTLNEGQKKQLERIQRKATKVILNCPPNSTIAGYRSYELRLQELKLESLEERWSTLFQRLAFKIEQDLRFQKHLPTTPLVHGMTLRHKHEYHLPPPRTQRLAKTTVSAAAGFLNGLKSTREQRLGTNAPVINVYNHSNSTLTANLSHLENSILRDLGL